MTRTYADHVICVSSFIAMDIHAKVPLQGWQNSNSFAPGLSFAWQFAVSIVSDMLILFPYVTLSFLLECCLCTRGTRHSVVCPYRGSFQGGIGFADRCHVGVPLVSTVRDNYPVRGPRCAHFNCNFLVFWCHHRAKHCEACLSISLVSLPSLSTTLCSGKEHSAHCLGSSRSFQIKQNQDTYCCKSMSGQWQGFGECLEDLKWGALVDVISGNKVSITVSRTDRNNIAFAC